MDASSFHDRPYAPEGLYLQRSETIEYPDWLKRIRQALWFWIQYQVWKKSNFQSSLWNLVVHSTWTCFGANLWQDHWYIWTGHSALRAHRQPFSLSRDYSWKHEGNKNRTDHFWYESIHSKRKGFNWSPHKSLSSWKTRVFEQYDDIQASVFRFEGGLSTGSERDKASAWRSFADEITRNNTKINLTEATTVGAARTIFLKIVQLLEPAFRNIVKNRAEIQLQFLIRLQLFYFSTHKFRDLVDPCIH